MKLGRPKIAEQDRKGQITGVRLRLDERELLEKAASLKKLKLSGWIRETLLKTAVKQVSAKHS
jgi:uncharacterized protein (DUF1778 family)